MCCKHILMALDSVDLSSCQKRMYFLEIFDAQILKLFLWRHIGWESTSCITESHHCCHRLCYILSFLKHGQVVAGK